MKKAKSSKSHIPLSSNLNSATYEICYSEKLFLLPGTGFLNNYPKAPLFWKVNVSTYAKYPVLFDNEQMLVPFSSFNSLGYNWRSELEQWQWEWKSNFIVTIEHRLCQSEDNCEMGFKILNQFVTTCRMVLKELSGLVLSWHSNIARNFQCFQIESPLTTKESPSD